MLKRYLLLVLAFLLAAPVALSQNQQVSGALSAQDTGACTTAYACLALPLNANTASAVFQVSGTFSATFQFEGTADNTNWVSLNAVPIGSTSGVTSATAAGAWRVTASSLVAVRVRVSTYGSGTVNVVITSSPGNSGIGAGSASATTAQVSIATLTLTSAQILALHGTPVQIVAAPGVGKALVPISATMEYKYVSAPYQNTTDSNLVITTTGVVGVDELIVIPAASFIDQTASQFAMQPSSAIYPLADASNNALVVTNQDGSGEFTSGSGTLTITLWYATITLA